MTTIRAVFFDVGETLVDEERYWREVAAAAGVGPHVVWAALGKTIERGEEHSELWRHLGLERPVTAWQDVVYSTDDFYPDALDCLRELRGRGVVVGLAGNQSHALEAWARAADLPVDVVSGSGSLGVRKPDPGFFQALVELIGLAPAEVVYVGDRVDNDVLPAAQAGLVPIHLRRGPWGFLQASPDGVPVLESLDELAPLLDDLGGVRS